MPTVDKQFADRLIAANGYYVKGDEDNSFGDNPRVTRIVEYANEWGTKAYGVTYEGEDQMRYLSPTDYTQNPTIYWEYKGEDDVGEDVLPTRTPRVRD